MSLIRVEVIRTYSYLSLWTGRPYSTMDTIACYQLVMSFFGFCIPWNSNVDLTSLWRWRPRQFLRLVEWKERVKLLWPLSKMRTQSNSTQCQPTPVSATMGQLTIIYLFLGISLPFSLSAWWPVSTSTSTIVNRYFRLGWIVGECSNGFLWGSFISR